ncbi:mechanosensitive ion channel family protein [Saccharospirillum impatiens]|uniref:mechanosensitive ion channel family protein n=1 Tax=Saccharospirillum impatiens TaxID=169438 RepID=UPI0009FDDB48|nr:mechanosensitive ion channel family protein [Saccharospirillum impatiens]
MSWQYIVFLALLVAFFITHKALNYFIRRWVNSKDVPVQRKALVRKLLRSVHAVSYLIALGLTFGIEYGELTVFLSSLFAVIGIALFAQWSILSNLTASMIIFFQFPYRIGDRVRILNADYDLTGVIEEISSFHVMIRHDKGDLMTVPNTLMLQTPVIKLSGNKTSVINRVDADLAIPEAPGSSV